MTISYTPAAARQIVATLFITQCFGSAALIANATVNAIVGATLSGRDDLAGLPGTLLLIGAAGAAPISSSVPGNPAKSCLLYTSPSPRDQRGSRMPSSA